MVMHSRLTSTLTDATLATLAARHPFGRYAEDPSLPARAAREQVAQAARQFLTAPGATAIEAVDSGGQTAGVLLFRPSPWDTEHFGYPCVIVDAVLIDAEEYAARRAVAETLLGGLTTWLHAHGTRFTSVRVPARDLPVVHAVEAVGFAFIEAWVFSHRPTAGVAEANEPFALRPARPDDRVVMHACAAGAFDTQRFHADARVDRAKADALYSRWIDTSFSDPAMTTLVHEHEGRPVAFMTYFRSDLSATLGRRFAMWKMALIDPALRGQGLGTRFFDALARHHRDEGLDTIDSGVSLRNVASINLHARCGFRVTSTLLTFHHWSDARA